MQRAHRVVILALDGVYAFELGIPDRIFRAADGHYEVLTCTADGHPVRSESGFTITCPYGPEVLSTADTVVIPSVAPSALSPSLPEPVAAALATIPQETRMVSICTGSFVLAAGGLLDGRPATTHWELADLFRQWFPKVVMDPLVLFVDDGDVLTSAGAASGLDVCLHIVRKDRGSEVANRAARRCLVAPFREGGQAPYIEQLISTPSAVSTAATQKWALEHLHEPLRLADLAGHARMSPRTFARRFTDDTGVSPGRWLVQQRILRARHLLETSALSVDQIAGRVGFATGASLRQHLHAAVGISPRTYRRTFRGTL